jgi:glycine cleavage system H lipoate-binding protein/ABC-type phosphate transport system substrate-binding protein
MKSKLCFICIVLCILTITTKSEIRPDNGLTQENEPLDIQYSPELHPLITNWVDEYQLRNPALSINLRELTEVINTDDNALWFISDESIQAVTPSSRWKIVVGHDAIVPVVNSKNPFIASVHAQGITAQKLAMLFNGSGELDWATLIDKVPTQPLHFYLLDDVAIQQRLLHFTNTEEGLIKGIPVSTVEELLTAIQYDEFAIGFCRLNDLRKANSNEWIESIRPAPVDKNGNGRIDNFENIYQTPDAFARGVWIGKYPSTLCGSIYAMSSQKPDDESVIQFLTWILSDGGQFLSVHGFSDLASVEKEESIALLTPNESVLAHAELQIASNNWMFIFLGVIVVGLLLVYLIGRLAVPGEVSPSSHIHLSTGLNENTIEAPKGLYFDKTHTWSFIEKEGLVRIGLDDFMQHITGDITRVIMKKPGEKVHKGEKVLTLSCLGKQLTIYSPVTGIIQQNNPLLQSNSVLINESPYTQGWIYLIEPLNWLRELQSMLMADRYKEWLKSEFMRLKVFLSYAVSSNTSAYEHVILQDGGELHDNVLSDLGPEVWEEFQTKFIDAAN